MTELAQRLSGLAYAAGWRLVRTVPEGVARSTFRAAADLAARRGGPGASQLRRNLARVVPQASPAELDTLVRDGLRSYARYWRETFRLPAMNHHAVAEQLADTIIGREVIDQALDRGKGLILALPHAGNVDVSGLFLATYYGRFTTVAERLRPESVYRRFLAHRESLGFEILPLTGGPVNPYRQMMRRLRENRVVCLVADRDLTRTGCPVTFFGEPTRMPAGPAQLAASTGATLATAFTGFSPDGWALRIHSPVLVDGRAEVPSATQRLADNFAVDIAADPVDWHMLQPLWLADLPEHRRRELAQDPHP